MTTEPLAIAMCSFFIPEVPLEKVYVRIKCQEYGDILFYSEPYESMKVLNKIINLGLTD